MFLSLEEAYWTERHNRGYPRFLNDNIKKTEKQRKIDAEKKAKFWRDVKWKWGVIEKYTENLDSVVDVACGRIAFWRGRECRQYVGIDISKSAIEQKRLSRPDWKFINANAAEMMESVSGEVVLCIDLLYHVMNKKDFVNILRNLCHYSEKWIFIYTWGRNPFQMRQSPNYDGNPQKVSDGKYQYYRDLMKWRRFFKTRGFKLIAKVGKEKDGNWRTGICKFFIFRRIE